MKENNKIFSKWWHVSKFDACPLILAIFLYFVRGCNLKIEAQSS
jgi:hypothetical protein